MPGAGSPCESGWYTGCVRAMGGRPEEGARPFCIQRGADGWSVLGRKHDGYDALGHAGVGRIGRAELHPKVVAIDLPEAAALISTLSTNRSRSIICAASRSLCRHHEWLCEKMMPTAGSERQIGDVAGRDQCRGSELGCAICKTRL